MKTKILVFIDWYLPGFNSGGPVTSAANLTEHLKGDLEFYIITRNHDYCNSLPYENIKSDEWINKGDNTHIYYLSKGCLSKINILKAIKDISFNTWYVTGIYSWYFSIVPVFLARRHHPGKLIVAPRGMLSPHALGIKSFKKKIFLGLAKIIRLYKNASFHATSVEEENDVLTQFPKNDVVFVPNLPKPVNQSNINHVEKKPGSLKLLSIARIAPEKNTLEALKILEAFSQTMDPKDDYNISFDLYGHVYCLKYWEECNKVVEQLPMQIQVNFHGSVSPDNLPAFIENSHFLFLPSRGENFGHAILESLLLARPVIISDQTPWKNLRFVNSGWDISLQSPHLFISALKSCLEMEQDEYNSMCIASKAFIKVATEESNALMAYKQMFA
jgi:glycosyltransferase involved in cell wall biosynthesis